MVRAQSCEAEPEPTPLKIAFVELNGTVISPDNAALNTTLVRPVQLLKALPRKVVTPVPMVRLVMPLQP